MGIYGCKNEHRFYAIVGTDLPGGPEYIKNLCCKHVGLHTFVDRILCKFSILRIYTHTSYYSTRIACIGIQKI